MPLVAGEGKEGLFIPRDLTKSGAMAQAEIRNLGLTGALVTFSDTLSEAANRAALAFRDAVSGASVPDVTEVASTLTSVYVGFDPVATGFDTVRARLEEVLAQQDWMAATLPADRKLWRIPAVFDGPQLDEVAEMVGKSVSDAVEDIAQTRLRVLMLGFAPGQPYLGELPEAWAIPRQTGLTHVPAGAIVTTIRQITMFDRPSPTGWRWIGRMAFEMFRPDAEHPIALSPGDELCFEPVAADELTRRASKGNGGAEWDAL